VRAKKTYTLTAYAGGGAVSGIVCSLFIVGIACFNPAEGIYIGITCLLCVV
jgi:hypothetical protein